MPNIERNLRQTATYWAPGAEDSYGSRSYSAPVQLPCRWEDKTEMFIDKKGKESKSKSKVFFASDLQLDGYLLLGTSAETNPRNVANASEIRNVFRTPDLRNNTQLYVAIL